MPPCRGGDAVTGKPPLPLTAREDAGFNLINGTGEETMAEDRRRNRGRRRTGGTGRGNRNRRRRQARHRASTRRANKALADRPSGRSADCSWSILPSSAGCGIRTAYDLALQDWMGIGGLRPRRGPLAAALGGGLSRLSPPARSATGCARWAIASFRWSAGPSAAAMTRWATAIRCRAFTSPGAPVPASSSRSSAARARRRQAAG